MLPVGMCSHASNLSRMARLKQLRMNCSGCPSRLAELPHSVEEVQRTANRADGIRDWLSVLPKPSHLKRVVGRAQILDNQAESADNQAMRAAGSRSKLYYDAATATNKRNVE